ncbi:retrovirus-related pol polyprotein from transposon TNT 1-94 [Tanacetum coccineum]
MTQLGKEKASNVFLKEREQYFEIQDLKAQLQDKNIAISKLKKLIEKCKGKFVETKFDKPFVVRQLNDQRIPKPSVLGKPTPFSDSLERKSFSQTKSIPKTNVSEGFIKNQVTTQIFPQTARQAIRNTNVIKPGMCKIDTRTTQTRAPQLPQTSRNTNPRVSTSTRVIHNTNVSIPQLRSTQMKDKVVPNNSQVKVKKTEVEDHHRISSISNKKVDLVQGNITINRVYYVEGLNHNLFSVGQFYDADLEVAFQKSTCFVRDLQGNDLLTGNRGSDLYTISIQEMTSSTPIYLMAKALPTQACKEKRSSFKTKVVPSSKGRLNLLHMDLCGPIAAKSFLYKITLHAFFKEKGIEHQTFTPRTPEQNGAVEKTNQLSLRLLARCSQLLNFLCSFGLKQLQLHAILKTDLSSS